MWIFVISICIISLIWCHNFTNFCNWNSFEIFVNSVSCSFTTFNKYNQEDCKSPQLSRSPPATFMVLNGSTQIQFNTGQIQFKLNLCMVLLLQIQLKTHKKGWNELESILNLNPLLRLWIRLVPDWFWPVLHHTFCLSILTQTETNIVLNKCCHYMGCASLDLGPFGTIFLFHEWYNSECTT